jgi:hypothetical protein
MAKMSRDEIKRLQEIIGTDVDGIWGPKSRAAYSAWLDNGSQPSEDTFVSPEDTINAGKTTNFNLGDEYNVAEELGETKLDPNYGRDPRAKSGFDPMDSFVAPQMDNLYDKSTRIAEIQRRLDEIKREKEKYDVEEKMGEYKFLYDADPSTYTTYKQNLRSNEQTNAIRKASEDATKASQAQTAWRQLLIDEETAKYDAQAAQNKVNEAKQSGNAQAYSEAMTELSRINAKIKRLNRDKDEYRKRFAEMLGVSREEMGEQPSADWNKEGDVDYGKLNAIETLRGDIAIGKDKVRQLPTAVKPKVKEKNKADMTAEHARLKGILEQNKDILSPEVAAKLSTELSELEDAITNYGKNQRVTMTPEKFAKLNYAQLLKIGSSKALSNYKSKGFKNADLDKAIDRLASQGK